MSSALATLRRHWPEYLMEGALLGLFMVSAAAFGVLLEHPASPARAALPEAGTRRALMGLAMGATAVALIYCPWGRRSGAHFNPAVTLTYLRLGKVAPIDAACYVLAQFAGGLLGIALPALVARDWLADPAVNFVATVPGRWGVAPAFAAELLISALLMGMVLYCTARRRLERLTGVFAGLLVALYIAFEAPVSGMSINPARSFGSALPAGLWTAFWIYLSAPLLGMLLAAELYVRAARRAPVHCAKLRHADDQRCIHCE